MSEPKESKLGNQLRKPVSRRQFMQLVGASASMAALADGAPFTADDVVPTFMRIISPPEGVTSISKNDLAMVKMVEAVDPKTVKFSLSSPRAYFLYILAGTNMIIYSKKSLDENKGDLRK